MSSNFTQVHSVRTSKEALELLSPAASNNVDEAPFDIIIKEHEPQDGANACRLLRRMARTTLLSKCPVVCESAKYKNICHSQICAWFIQQSTFPFAVVSTNDEREVVVKCLTLGAIDYLIKPLRHNELRHIWTRVWWWRKV